MTDEKVVPGWKLNGRAGPLDWWLGCETHGATLVSSCLCCNTAMGLNDQLREKLKKEREMYPSHDYPACALFRGGRCTCDTASDMPVPPKTLIDPEHVYRVLRDARIALLAVNSGASQRAIADIDKIINAVPVVA